MERLASSNLVKYGVMDYALCVNKDSPAPHDFKRNWFWVDKTYTLGHLSCKNKNVLFGEYMHLGFVQKILRPDVQGRVFVLASKDGNPSCYFVAATPEECTEWVKLFEQVVPIAKENLKTQQQIFKADRKRPIGPGYQLDTGLTSSHIDAGVLKWISQNSRGPEPPQQKPFVLSAGVLEARIFDTGATPLSNGGALFVALDIPGCYHARTPLRPASALPRWQHLFEADLLEYEPRILVSLWSEILGVETLLGLTQVVVPTGLDTSSLQWHSLHLTPGVGYARGELHIRLHRPEPNVLIVGVIDATNVGTLRSEPCKLRAAIRVAGGEVFATRQALCQNEKMAAPQDNVSISSPLPKDGTLCGFSSDLTLSDSKRRGRSSSDAARSAESLHPAMEYSSKGPHNLLCNLNRVTWDEQFQIALPAANPSTPIEFVVFRDREAVGRAVIRPGSRSDPPIIDRWLILRAPRSRAQGATASIDRPHPSHVNQPSAQGRNPTSGSGGVFLLQRTEVMNRPAHSQTTTPQQPASPARAMTRPPPPSLGKPERKLSSQNLQDATVLAQFGQRTATALIHLIFCQYAPPRRVSRMDELCEFLCHRLTVDLADLIEDLSDLRSRNDIAEHLLEVYLSRGVAEDAIQKLLQSEARRTVEADTLFRANTVTTKSTERYLKIIGLDYLKECIKPTLQMIHEASLKKILFCDPILGGDARGAGLLRSSVSASSSTGSAPMASVASGGAPLEQVPSQGAPSTALPPEAQVDATLRCLDALFDDLDNSVPTCPITICKMLRFIKMLSERQFQEQADVSYKGITGFLCLRFFTVAIVSPQVFGLLLEPEHPESQQNRKVISKIFQRIGNFTRFPENVQAAKTLEDYQNRLKNYIDSLIQRAPSPCNGSASLHDADMSSAAEDDAADSPSLTSANYLIEFFESRLHRIKEIAADPEAKMGMRQASARLANILASK